MSTALMETFEVYVSITKSCSKYISCNTGEIFNIFFSWVREDCYIGLHTHVACFYNNAINGVKDLVNKALTKIQVAGWWLPWLFEVKNLI